VHIKVITEDREFDRVKDEWLDFEKEVNNQNITSSYIWQRTWWQHFKDYEMGNFGSNKKLCILFLYDGDNTLRAIAPLCEATKKVYGLTYRAIEFVAQQWGATYLDIISDKLSKEEYNFIFDWLKRNRRYDLIELRYIPEFTLNFDLKETDITVLSGCPEIVSEGYDSVWNNYYGKNLKHKLRRIRNKVKREGIDLTTSYLSSNEVLNRFAEIRVVSISKELSSKHSLYQDAQKENFVKSLINSYSEDAKCSSIDYNGKAVAYNLGFEVNKKYYAWDAAYNRNEKELESLSLGNLNYDYLIQSTYDRGIRNLCLSAGIDPYKLKFSKQIVRIYTLLRKGNSLRGVFLYVLKKRLNQRTANVFEEELKINLQRD